MQFRDLYSQYDRHKEIIDRSIEEVLRDTNFIGGRQVAVLEDALAEYVGVKHCISCANGTDALQLALMAWNIGNGDVVFVPDFTFFSSGEVVPLVGATPVFVDIKEDTYNIDPDALEEQIEWVISNTELKPKVIVAVDLFGQPAEFDRIRLLANKYNMLVLEDAAQGFGGMIKGKRACGFGDISTTSFFPAKPLGCYGDGGAIFTDNDEWAVLLRSYKVHGKGVDKYDNVRIGINSRLDTIQASILLAKLSFFDNELKACNEIADIYNMYLEGCKGVITPCILEDYDSAWAQYTIMLNSEDIREKVIRELKEADIPAMIYYRKPMHTQKAFNGNLIGKDQYKVTTRVCRRCLSLPMSAYINIEDVKTVAETIKRTVNAV